MINDYKESRAMYTGESSDKEAIAEADKRAKIRYQVEIKSASKLYSDGITVKNLAMGDATSIILNAVAADPEISASIRQMEKEADDE